MSKRAVWVQVAIILAGTLLGSMAAGATKSVRALSWLSYGDRFAFSPFTLDLGVVHLTLGFGIDVCIGMLLGLLISIVIARKVR